MSTEDRSLRSVDIDTQSTTRILEIINAEDASVAAAVRTVIPEIARAVDAAVASVQAGGRILYAGAGTSGRIAVLDAAECPPTFNSPADWVQAVLAGGRSAFECAEEGSEDDRDRAAADLRSRDVGPNDLVIGIAASGRTPYTHAALQYATSVGAKTVAIVSVCEAPMSAAADIFIPVVTGPEVIAGSTRMKAGTAQKMVLNMISTAVMIRLGLTYGNWMINVRMTNRKLRQRGLRILQEILGVDAAGAERLADASGGELKVAVLMGKSGIERERAAALLAEAGGDLRRALGER